LLFALRDVLKFGLLRHIPAPPSVPSLSF